MFYRQCELQLVGEETRQVVWIPINMAKKGNHVEIGGERWLVTETYRDDDGGSLDLQDKSRREICKILINKTSAIGPTEGMTERIWVCKS